MAWNLDIEDYTNDELMELFNINGVDSNDTKARSLITALQKVQNDKTKTQNDLKDFKNFVDNVSKRLNIDENEFNYQLNNLPEMNAIQQSFSQKQPVSIVNDHVLISNKSLFSKVIS